MFWLWRKNAVKNVINKETGKLERLSVVCEKYSYYTDYWRNRRNLRTLDNVLCFNLNIEKYLKYLHYPSHQYYKVYEKLESIYQDFILTANKRFCSDCYWRLRTIGEDGALARYESDEVIEMTKTLLAASPFIFHADIDYVFLELRLTNMDSSIFETLSCSKFPDGEQLDMDVFNTSITAYHPQNRDELDAYEDTGLLFSEENGLLLCGKKIELDIDRSDIAFASRRYDEVKSCLIEVFTKHGIELEFIDKIEKTKKGQ